MDGLADLNKRLEELTHRMSGVASQRAVRAGVNVLAKAIRAEIDLDPVFADETRMQLKALVGRGSRRTAFGAAGRAGFGVGISKSRARRRSGRNRTGVGLSEFNVHWHIAGTKDRYVGTQFRRRRRGGPSLKFTGNAIRFAGRMRPSACVSRAIARSRDDVSRAMVAALQHDLFDPS